MSKGGTKLTYEEIKEYVNNNGTGNGCELITTEEEFKKLIEQKQLEITKKVKISQVKFEIKCRCGEKFWANYSNFKISKKQCYQCNKEQVEYKKRLQYEDVINYINNPETGNGCEVITTKEEFEELAKTAEKPSQIKLQIRCACGEPFTAYYTQFKINGKRQCNKCGYKILGEKLTKDDYEAMKEYINGENGEGCILLTTKEEYEEQRVNNKMRPTDVILDIMCSCKKNTMKLSFSRFKDKKQCNECSYKSVKEKSSIDYDEISKYINTFSTGEGCELLTNKEEFYELNKYIKATAVKLNIRCACGEKYTTTFGNFKRLNKSNVMIAPKQLNL
jgi:acetone carboxylase gamma subunit